MVLSSSFSFSSLCRCGPRMRSHGEKIRFCSRRRQEEEGPPSSFLVRGAHRVILFHQQVISPVDGPRSSFRPTSCRYMYHAMRRYGFWNGFLMGCDRLMRENSDPWVYRTKKIGAYNYRWDPPRAEEARSFSLSSREALPCSLKRIGDPEN